MKLQPGLYIFGIAAAGLLRAVGAQPVPADSLPALHIIGDSTVHGTGQGIVGWGERIQPFFDTNKIKIVNEAIAGRSARTFFTEGRWANVERELKPGDFLIIQFGHNDGGRIADPATKHRADGAGIGEETVPDIMPDGSTNLVHTFGWYMTQFVTGAKAKGATVILCSPIPHKQRWEHGRDFANFADWDRQIAEARSASFIDLTLIVTDAYKKLGMPKVEPLFADAGTHTTSAGAELNATCVIAGLRSLPENPFNKFLSGQGRLVEPYRSAIEGR